LGSFEVVVAFVSRLCVVDIAEFLDTGTAN